MSIDCEVLDRLLRQTWSAWRVALMGLQQRPREPSPSPLERWLPGRASDVLDELARRADEPRAAPLYGWVRAFTLEHAVWGYRVERALAWDEVESERDGASGYTLRALHHRAIRLPDRREGSGAGALLAARAFRLAELVRQEVAERAIHERALGPVPAVLTACVGVEPDRAQRLALGLLVATEPLAHELRDAIWCDTLHGALGRAAGSGWPAVPSARWAHEVLRSIDDRRCSSVSPARLEPWGALSFARALGHVAVRWLEGARERGTEFAASLRPLGHRRHERFALVGGLILERSFARRELGLGARRAREHQRAVARSLVRALRIDAMRVIVWHALARDGEAALESYQQVGARVLGPALPPALLGVVPTVGPSVAGALVGRVTAALGRRTLVATFGDDWYRNPKCEAWFRSDDARLESRDSPSDALLDAAVEELRGQLEALC